MDALKATANELGELFTLMAEGPLPLPPGHHPGADLLGRMAVGDLDKTTGRNVAEHANGCRDCQITINGLLLVATGVAQDRQRIGEQLGLSVNLVDALRAGRRERN